MNGNMFRSTGQMGLNQPTGQVGLNRPMGQISYHQPVGRDPNTPLFLHNLLFAQNPFFSMGNMPLYEREGQPPEPHSLMSFLTTYLDTIGMGDTFFHQELDRFYGRRQKERKKENTSK